MPYKPDPVQQGVMPRTISIPAGKIGVAFAKDATPCSFSRIADDSPLAGLVEAGEIVIGVTVPQTLELVGLQIPTLTVVQTLDMHSEREDRTLTIWENGAPLQPGIPTRLPKGAQPGGVWWKRLRNDVDDSVHADSVSGVMSEFAPVYQNPDGTWINKFGYNTRPGTYEYEWAVTPEAARMDCVYTAWLRAGSVGIVLGGNPNQIKRIHPESPLKDIVRIGQTVVECAVDGEIEMEGNLSAGAVGRFLKQHEASEDRTLKLTLKDDPSVETKGPIKMVNNIEELPEHTAVLLPAGVAGLSFRGTPCMVSRVAEDSPVASQVRLGQQVVGAKVDGKIVLSGTNLSATDVGKFLVEHKTSDSREVLITQSANATFANAVVGTTALANMDIHDWSPPTGAQAGGMWMYKEPGLEGKVLDKNGQPVTLAFSVLTSL